MNQTRFRSLVALVALLLIGCSGEELAPPAGLDDPGLSNVKTENAAARSAAIDEAGGTLTATGANGAVYTLTIPAEAVDSSVEIRMYPIASMTGYPLAAGMKAGVHLEPEGFAPRVPMTLTIDLPSTPDPKTIAAIASRMNGEDYYAYPAAVAGSRVTFSITHFSQYTTGDAELDEFIEVRPNAPGAEQFQHDLAVTYTTTRSSGESPDATYMTIMGNWYRQVIEPIANRVSAASDYATADAALNELIREFNAWRCGKSFCELTAEADDFGFSSVLPSVNQAITSALVNYLIVANALMEEEAGTDPNGPGDDGVMRMARIAGIVLATQRIADVWGVITPTNGLDLESVLDGMPIAVAIVSETLPAGFNPGGVGNLTIRAGVKILDRPVRTSPAVFVSLSNHSSVTTSPSSGWTNAQGEFTTTAQWTHGSQAMSIDVVASLPFGSNGTQLRVRVFDRITKQMTVQPLKGSWRKDGHVWISEDGTENPNGMLVSTVGSTRIQAFSTFNVPRLAFELPVTWTGNTFSGSAIVSGGPPTPTFQGWTATVSGEIRADSSLQFEWLIAQAPSSSWHGSGVLPFVK